ncbi:hypothetical protein QTO34_000989 [Cnephaeus nilssonii]|uniref:Large ribosomal subunit protein uL18m n=1 Tax=Cnephaeus nilssonii TaxID=3371016 RepID=A0AA40LN94_CNENI|nr:hypothetical protein QTO34_000989 [Eptesicus nilssonii]
MIGGAGITGCPLGQSAARTLLVPGGGSLTYAVLRLFPELIWPRPALRGVVGFAHGPLGDGASVKVLGVVVGSQEPRAWGRGALHPFRAEVQPEVQPEADPLGNEAVAPEFTNRNPRNLELLAVARKERGWGTVWPSREFWHRLRVIRTQHHVEALVEHRNGQVVVSASTREWAIKKHLYSTRNVAACENIGRVLAERCLEAGINFMVYQPTPWEAASESMQRLQRAVTEGGVVLQEPRRIYE